MVKEENKIKLPINYCQYIKDGVKKKFFPITSESAVYDSQGGVLSQKLITIKNNFGESFDEQIDYLEGDICIYLNCLYKFTEPKLAGQWDKTKVTQITLQDAIGYEEGTNANGSYRKWNNGYLEQYIDKIVTMDISNAYGSIYQAVKSFSWPIEFRNITCAMISRAQYSTGASWGTLYNVSNTYYSVRALDVVKRASANAMHITVYGNGTWR